MRIEIYKNWVLQNCLISTNKNTFIRLGHRSTFLIVIKFTVRWDLTHVTIGSQVRYITGERYFWWLENSWTFLRPRKAVRI